MVQNKYLIKIQMSECKIAYWAYMYRIDFVLRAACRLLRYACNLIRAP